MLFNNISATLVNTITCGKIYSVRKRARFEGFLLSDHKIEAPLSVCSIRIIILNQMLQSLLRWNVEMTGSQSPIRNIPQREALVQTTVIRSKGQHWRWTMEWLQFEWCQSLSGFAFRRISIFAIINSGYMCTLRVMCLRCIDANDSWPAKRHCGEGY